MLTLRSIACAAGCALIAVLSGPPVWAQDGARREDGARETQAPAATLTTPPALLQAVAPEYPPAALEAGLEAAVLVRIHIDATGVVTQVDVVEPVGNGFDEAAVAAAEQYLFSPAEWDGVPGPIIVETTIHFTIAVEAAPDSPDSPDSSDSAAPPDAASPDVTPEPPSTPAASGASAAEPTPKAPANAPTADPQSADTLGSPAHGGDLSRPVTVAGEALERGTRRPLSGAIVSIAELGLDVISDDAGRFFFHGLPVGEYRVIAVSDGYDRLERPLAITAANERVEVRLWMRPEGGNPYETVVEGQREVLEVTRRTLERRQLTSVPGTFGDPIRVIQALPGLARSPFSTGLLLIRGSNPDDSGIFIDGHRVPLIFHFLGGPSILNPEFLDSIDLYPGGYPARFGRALGGIVAVESRPSQDSKGDGTHGSVDIDVLDAGAYLRVPIGEHGSIAVAGRRSYLNFLLDFALPEPSEGSTLVVVPVYYDYQLRLDYDLQAEGKASVFLLGSSDALDVLSADDEEESSLDLGTRVEFLRLISTYKRPLAGGLRLTMSPVVGRDRVSFRSAQADAIDAFTSAEIIQDTIGYRMRVDGRVHPLLVLDAGVDLESRVTRYDLRIPDLTDFDGVGGQVDVPPEDLARNIDFFGYGLHADLGWDATSALRLVPGLRFDGYWLNGERRYTLDPRLVARYQLTPSWLLKGNLGLFHQPPAPEVVDSLIGNRDLDLEHARHFGAGVEWKPRPHWSIDAEIYYVDRYDQIAFSDDNMVTEDPDTGEVTITPVRLRNSGVSDTVGLELLVKRDITRNFYGWLAYTLSYSRRQLGPEEPETPTLFDQRHVLNAVASYRVGRGWELGARFRLASGTPVTPIIDGTFDADSGGYRPREGEPLGARRPLFHQLDVRAEKTWLFNYLRVSVFIDIQNLLNIDNVEALQYDYRFRERAPVTSVPFLPTLGVKGSW
ncbi:MAG: hypothetical protein Tsb0020_13200 [Haliangiales bacterium]